MPDLHPKSLAKVTEKTVGGDPVTLVKDGKPQFAIVWDKMRELATRGGSRPSATPATQLLAETFEAATGTRPPVVKETAAKPVKGPAIFVGDTAAAKAAGLAAPADNPEAFRVVTKDGSVYLLGPCGYAAYDWCERQLGARYYWPDRPNDNIKHRKEGTNEVYGLSTIATKGLKVRPVDYDDRPVFGYRIHWPYGGSSYTAFAKEGGAHRGGVQVHCPFWGRDKDAQKHPGIYAMDAEGKRLPKDLLCYGNPETLEYFKWRLEEELAGRMKCGFYNPRNKVVTVSQADCSVYCECEHCKKLFRPECGSSGDASPAIWGYFTKRFAKWLKETHPDLKIAILPYHNTCDVPMDPDDPTKMLDLSPYGNVEAELCTMPGLAMMKNEACKKHEEDLIRQWVKCTGNPVYNWHYTCWPAEYTAAPYVYGETVKRHYQDMRECVVGSFLNGGYDQARFSLSIYVWMRVLWNPDVDVQALYDEFAKRMFGAAARPMRKLIQMQEAGWNRQWRSNICSVKNVYEISYPPADVQKMKDLLAEAEKLAAGDEKASARLAWYKSGFEKFFQESEQNASGVAFPKLSMKKAATPPKLDGKLDDACWATAEALPFVSAQSNWGGRADWDKTHDPKKPADYATDIKIVWVAGEGVVFGFKCTEPQTSAMKAGVEGDVWDQDNVEIFIDASGAGEGHNYHILADAYGRVDFNATTEWKPKGLVCKTSIDKGFWTMELFVPFSDLEKFPNRQLPTTSANGCRWNGNLIRFRVGDCKLPKEQRAEGSHSEISRLNTRFNKWNKDPAAFSEWQFVE